MSKWEHAKVGKRVINLDHAGDRRVMCAWDDCEKEGYEMYKIRTCTHSERIPCAHPTLGTHLSYVFCSHRHMVYWGSSSNRARGGTLYGMLPSGYRTRAG